MKRIEVEGTRIAFHDHGAGPPVLLLHGFPLTSESFRPQLGALAGKLRLIVPDHRGFGESGPAGAEATEMSRIARDALAVLDALGIRRAVVGGVSMGGYAAMAMLREDAGRVAGLILIDTQAAADDEAGKARRADTAKAVEARGTQALVDAMLGKLVSDRCPPAARDAVERMIRAQSPEGCAAAVRGMALRPAGHDVLSRFAGPSLVVVGEQDVITPPAKAQELAKLLQGSRLVEIPGAGHLANLEAPGPVNEAMAEFARSLPAALFNG
ncbi:MAG TPA: alpha/beta fold hydrolase [Myxococcaceae bacterium]|nr:alpha/beta fold hydrolase [Myxococcaceae bacterium]